MKTPIKRSPQVLRSLVKSIFFGFILVFLLSPLPALVNSRFTLINSTFLNGALVSCGFLLFLSLREFLMAWRLDRWRDEATQLSVQGRQITPLSTLPEPFSLSIRPRWFNPPLFIQLLLLTPLQVFIILQLISLPDWESQILIQQSSQESSGIGIIFAALLLLVQYGWSLATSKQRLDFDETGLTLREGRTKTTLHWQDINLCAVVHGLDAVKTYEVSSTTAIIRFDVLRTYSLTMVPMDQSFATYNRAAAQIESYISTKTGLPFFDLRSRTGSEQFESAVIVPQEGD